MILGIAIVVLTSMQPKLAGFIGGIFFLIIVMIITYNSTVEYNKNL